MQYIESIIIIIIIIEIQLNIFRLAMIWNTFKFADNESWRKDG